MRTLFALLIMASTAHAELLAEFSWDNPRPVVGATEYMMASYPVIGPSFPPVLVLGGRWQSTGNETLSSGPDFDLFEEWWTGGDGRYSTISGLNVCDSVDCQQDNRYRTGISLDVILDNTSEDLISYGWYGKRHVPQLGHVLYGYDITHMERIVTPTQQRIEIHGHAIPEPGTLLMAMLAAIWLHDRSRSFLRRRDDV